MLLALCAGSSSASAALREVGITRGVIERSVAGLSLAPVAGPAEPRAGQASLRGDGERIFGFATGLASARGEPCMPEHYLFAIAYLPAGQSLLAVLGTAPTAIIDALRRRGIRAPGSTPPDGGRPFRHPHTIEVAETDVGAIVAILQERHPPGSAWRWGFRWIDGDPRRAEILAEEGVDFPDVVRAAQRR
jgi:hypothetical protein